MKLQAVGWIVRDNEGVIRAVRTKHQPCIRTFDEAYPDQAPHVLKELFEKVGAENQEPPTPNRRKPTSIIGKIRAMRG